MNDFGLVKRALVCFELEEMTTRGHDLRVPEHFSWWEV